MNREMLLTYAGWVRDLLIEQGMGPGWAKLINALLLIIAVAIVATILDIITRKIIV